MLQPAKRHRLTYHRFVHSGRRFSFIFEQTSDSTLCGIEKPPELAVEKVSLRPRDDGSHGVTIEVFTKGPINEPWIELRFYDRAELRGEQTDRKELS